MRMTCLILLALFCLGVATAEAPPPIVGGGDATIYDIAGTSTLVTVKVKSTGALDKNLRILDVHEDRSEFSVLSEDNEPGAFMFSDVQEIHVQGGKVEVKKILYDESQTLRAEDQKVVKRAFSRAREIYGTSDNKQSVKIRAAMLLALNREEEAREYLQKLAAANDLETALQATYNLYLAGQTEADTTLLTKGLNSGNRRIRALAAVLTGLFKDQANVAFLNQMIQDRSADLAAPAARALGILGNRDCIPALLRMLTELNEEKGEAAVYALTRLGGQDIAQQMKLKYPSAIGETRFRIARVLYSLGDPMGRELLQNEFMQVPTLAPQAAMLLAAEGDWAAMQLLRDRLARRFDPLDEILKSRADAALALIAGGENAPTAVLQDLLRSEKNAVRVYVCLKIAKANDRQLLAITQPCIESSENPVALTASNAAISLADPDGFRERYLIALDSVE